MGLHHSPVVRALFVIAAVVISGTCWFISFGLSGTFWWLVWIAPVAVLLVSQLLSPSRAFLVSFLAYFLGRLSWWTYLTAVLPVGVAAALLVVQAIVFGAIVVLTRRVMLTQRWWAVFSFPVFWTSYEYILFRLSPDGTAASMAYTQSDFLPLVQLASVTGIEGITFFLAFMACALTMILFNLDHPERKKKLSMVAITVFLGVMGFGLVRMNLHPDRREVKVGMISLPESLHEETASPDTARENALTAKYLAAVSAVARQGARIAVLPEKAITFRAAQDSLLVSQFRATAATDHIAIVIGITRVQASFRENLAWVFSRRGEFISEYSKVNLFGGEARRGFRPGKTTSTFWLDSIPSGVAICKDLDFQQFIRTYHDAEVRLLFVPAWDFVADDWLHSRMAIFRGVENGYSMIRVARLGRLTISDARGRVTTEGSTSSGGEVVLTGTAALNKTTTLYSQFGDWFSWLNLLAAVCFLYPWRRKRQPSV